MKKELIYRGTGERVDKFLSTVFSDYSRSYFINLINDKEVIVNGKSVKPSFILKDHDQIVINFQENSIPLTPRAEDINLNIIHEDENVIVINKQPGLVVHPASGNETGTLINALLNHFPDIKHAVYDKDSLVSQNRPGLVHRLDKDTSGVLIVAKNARAMHSLSRQIQNRTVKKIYLGLCYGWPKNDSGQLISFLGRHPKNRKMIANIGEEKGREAITFYQVVEYLKIGDEKFSLIKFDLKTGRTHQIRVQASDMGNPILGDKFYGTKPSKKLSEKENVLRQLLHASSLTIQLPNETKPRTFEAQLPEDMKKMLDKATPVNC